MKCGRPVAAQRASSRTLLRSMADNMQLPPPGGPAGYSAVAVQPGSPPGRGLLTAVLLVAGGALLGLIGGAIWAAAAPRVVYQVYTLHPPTAFATNPETNAFIAADGVYTFIALGGGALLGLAGYLAGVRRYGPVPMAGIVLGAVAAAFVAKWLGPLLTGQDSFNAQLGSSKPGTLLRAPIALGASGALAFWPVAAGLVAGGLELTRALRARQLSQGGGPGGAAAGLPSARHAHPARRGRFGQRPGQQPDDGAAPPDSPAAGRWRPDSAAPPQPGEPAVRVGGPPPEPWFPADGARGAAPAEAWFPGDPPDGAHGHPVSGEPPDADGSAGSPGSWPGPPGRG